jgi:FkbM family methyltransferase
MSVKSSAFDFCVRIFERSVKIFGPAAYWKVLPLLVEKVDLWYPIETRKGILKMHCGGEIARVRAQKFHTSEPETLAWIDGFSKEDVFLDIGANVGVYSLYASFVGGIKCIAIEPSPFSFVEMAHNIMANGLSDLVVAINAAVSDERVIAPMNYASVSLKSGGSGAIFETTVDNTGKNMAGAGRLQQPGFAIDDIVKWPGVPFPNHIKIDVVGNQGRILIGARETLRDSRMKSVMVELHADLPEEDHFARDALRQAGFIQAHPSHTSNVFFIRQ